MNIDNPLTAYRITQIIEALHGRALCVDQVAAEIALCRAQAGRYLRQLHDAGVIYVADWTTRKEGRSTRLEVYRLGSRRDVPRPPNMTKTERQAAYKARIYADPEQYDKFKAINRARRRPTTRDPLVAAMFGPGLAKETQHGAH